MTGVFDHCEKCGRSVDLLKSTGWIGCRGNCPVASSPYYRNRPARTPEDELRMLRIELMRQADIDATRIKNLATNLDEDLTISGCTSHQALLALLSVLVAKCLDYPGGHGSAVFGLLAEVGKRSFRV